MRRSIIAVVAVLAVAAAWTIADPTPAASEDGIAVYFSSKGGTDAIIQEIGNAQETVIVQAFRISSQPIREALVDAHKRGVFVHLVLDAHQRNNKFTKWFVDHDIPVLLDAEHRMAHAVIVIDGETIITGNFAVPRGGQGELLIITGKPRLARAYLNNIDEHRDHSEVSPFEPPPLP